MKPWNVEICDTTLRDGEQTPGVSFSCEEKSEIARMLDAVGIEVIEAGFPNVSANEKLCVKTIADLGLSARICCLARARTPDVTAAIDCGVDMVSIFIPTSDLHIRLKFRKSREQVLEEALQCVEYARDHGAAAIGLVGFGGGRLKALVDKAIVLSSRSYQQVEDVHMVLAHIIPSRIKEKIEAL